uniref:NADH-ubiquinone oxidoreductase chain 6 n=1 Tax=Dolicheulota formosensis TaxID=1632114 RepID=A0A0H3W555_DOLFO|nr:NADH dehydrogenase subunit 6 [Dolicheulota formosensis]AKJ85736.1 NADH dehydrogenase subunit 6 [Dolicheulota formosensis]
MSWIYFLGVCVFFFMVWLMFLLVVSSSPANSLLFFMGVVISSMCLFYFMLSDMLCYLIFLVYIGGLLVLLIYMVMISSNMVSPSSKSFLYTGLFSLSLMVLSLITDENKSTSNPISSFDLPFDSSLVVVMGLLLFYLFLYLCSVVSVGGRSMNIGNIS